MRGRFAPSPSGEMHLGNAWTALLVWLQVRSQGGTMVLRIEDLDPDRSKQAYITQLISDLHWLGLDWEEGPDVGGPYAPYCQDTRRDFYRQAVGTLAEKGLIYPCYCTRAEIRGMALAPNGVECGLEYPGTCLSLSNEERAARELAGRKPALRVRVPDREISFSDLVQGSVSQNLARRVGDFAVTRTDGVHAYQLAVVVDDGLMEITHVLRGDDLLFSTPRQLWLYEELGLPVPQFAHVPLLYGWDGQRLSKRHGSTAIAALRVQGVRPENIMGYLGFRAGFLSKPEPVQARELIPEFSLEKISREPVVIPKDINSLF